VNKSEREYLDKFKTDLDASLGGIAKRTDQIGEDVSDLKDKVTTLTVSVGGLQAVSHNPLDCGQISKHMASDHRAIDDRTRLIFYVVGAVVVLGGAGAAIAGVFF